MATVAWWIGDGSDGIVVGQKGESDGSGGATTRIVLQPPWRGHVVNGVEQPW